MIEWLFALVLFLLGGALALRYVYWSIDRETLGCARAAADPAFRAEEIARAGERLDDNPRDAAARRRRAELFALDERFAEAAADWRLFLHARPDDDAAWHDFAFALDGAGRPAEAVDAADRAARLDPDYPEYAETAARLALAAGDPDRALDRIGRWRDLECRLAARRAAERGGARGRSWLWSPPPNPAPAADPPPPGLAPLVYEAAALWARGDACRARLRHAEARSLDPDAVERLLAEYPELQPPRGE